MYGSSFIRPFLHAQISVSLKHSRLKSSFASRSYGDDGGDCPIVHFYNMGGALVAHGCPCIRSNSIVHFYNMAAA